MTTIADAEITAIEAEIAAEFASAVEFAVASPEVSAESFAAFAANY
jgi:TPP-dependent pyruvate/acetoin dehydrogenase alpha subunit